MRTQKAYWNQNLSSIESSDPRTFYQRETKRNQKTISLKQQLKTKALTPEEVVIRLFKQTLRQDLINYSVFSKKLWFSKSKQVALMQSIISGYKNYLGESLATRRHYKNPDELKAWLRPVVVQLWSTWQDHSRGETPLLRAVVWRAFDKASRIETLIADERVKFLEAVLETTQEELDLLKAANPDLCNTFLANKKTMETITAQLKEMDHKVNEIVVLKERITQLEEDNSTLQEQLKKSALIKFKQPSSGTSFFSNPNHVEKIESIEPSSFPKSIEETSKSLKSS